MNIYMNILNQRNTSVINDFKGFMMFVFMNNL